MTIFAESEKKLFQQTKKQKVHLTINLEIIISYIIIKSHVEEECKTHAQKFVEGMSCLHFITSSLELKIRTKIPQRIMATLSRQPNYYLFPVYCCL